MDNQNMSPLPEEARKQVTYTFYDAIREAREGKSIRRLEWQDTTVFCVLKDELLTIYTDGKFQQWVISAGDIDGIDWIVIPEFNIN